MNKKLGHTQQFGAISVIVLRSFPYIVQKTRYVTRYWTHVDRMQGSCSTHLSSDPLFLFWEKCFDFSCWFGELLLTQCSGDRTVWGLNRVFCMQEKVLICKVFNHFEPSLWSIFLSSFTIPFFLCPHSLLAIILENVKWYFKKIYKTTFLKLFVDYHHYCFKTRWE